MSNPQSLLILCYHGNLFATFLFRLETFLSRERWKFGQFKCDWEKTNWKHSRIIFSAQWDINFGWGVLKLSENFFPIKLLETVALVVRKNSRKNFGPNRSFSALWDYPGGTIWGTGACFWSHLELLDKVVILIWTRRSLPLGRKRTFGSSDAYHQHKISLSSPWDFPGGCETYITELHLMSTYYKHIGLEGVIPITEEILEILFKVTKSMTKSKILSLTALKISTKRSDRKKNSAEKSSELPKTWPHAKN